VVHVGIVQSALPFHPVLCQRTPSGPLFEDLFFTALARFRNQQRRGTRQHKFRFKNKLLRLDSTTI
jgi:hypothetical protein